MLTIDTLPAPLTQRTGFPWTEGTPAGLSDSSRPDLPRITVVTPSYNQGRFLEETIRSVLLQGYPNLEYIVIDGGSTDESKAVIARYAPFLDYHVSEKDAGQANAINKGFARGTGDIMGWLNSDDVLLPGALWRIAEAFMSQPDADFVTGMRRCIDENSAWKSNFVRDKPSAHYLRHYCVLAQETTYWRRSTWDALGPLDESFQFAMDYEYWLRGVSKGMTFAFIPHYTGCFREYATNKTFSWMDVYYRDLQRLYVLYDMGKSEAEILAKLGGRWRRRYAWFLRASQQRWTNHRRLVLLTWWLTDLPLVSEIAFASSKLGELYKDARTYRGMSSLRAIGHTIATLWCEVWRVLARGEGTSPAQPGDIRHLPSLVLQPEIVRTTSPDTLVLGNGWYSAEIDKGQFAICSTGDSQLLLLNPTARRMTLDIVVKPIQLQMDDALLVSVEGVEGETMISITDEVSSVRVPVMLPDNAERAVIHLRWKHEPVLRAITAHRPQAFRISSLLLTPA
ncbi:MAG: glycosyltransferase [Pleurocapsa minor GSE-CHR-MK-17-07R]|nr:glycosyltransferase [Pleurocapsa minor GSE-CHR-MK 17-07R]